MHAEEENGAERRGSDSGSTQRDEASEEDDDSTNMDLSQLAFEMEWEEGSVCSILSCRAPSAVASDGAVDYGGSGGGEDRFARRSRSSALPYSAGGAIVTGLGLAFFSSSQPSRARQRENPVHGHLQTRQPFAHSSSPRQGAYRL